MTCGTLLMENLHNKNITKKLHSLVGSILNSTTHISNPTTHALQVGLLTSQKCVTGYNKLISQHSYILLLCNMTVSPLCAHYRARS